MGAGRQAFLSYSHVDADVVEQLERDLDALGWDAWCDRELSGGQRWWDGILDNLRECDLFVFALSVSSLRSEACERELEYATALGKPVLPVLVGDPVPEALLPPLLSETLWVDVRESDSRSSLALARALMETPPAPPLPTEMPTPPDVPVSYLADLKARVEQPKIPADAQWPLLTELEQHLANPDERVAALVLVEQFAARGDLMQSVAVAARRVRDNYRDGSGSQAVTPPPAPPPAEDELAETGRRRWLVAAAVLVVIAAGAATVFVVTRDSEPEDTLAAFCSQARSADGTTDRASAFLATPEADPVEMERLFEQAMSEVKAMATTAPEEIADAVVVVVGAYEEQGRLMARHDWSLAPAATELFESLTDATVVNADSDLSEFLSEECGIAWAEVGGFTDVTTAAEGLAVIWAAASLAIPATVDEASCMAADLTAEIDGDRLLALYGQSVTPTRSESITLIEATDECIENERMVPGFTAINFANLPGTTEEQQQCLGLGVLDTFTLTGWASTTLGTPEQIDDLSTVADDCGVDPRLVVPLLGG